ncbi:hypothetical protein [Treponema sp.]|uniref:hypothetical protein n=1 Tax=Treponema sp. TaxID=166 RepID=UPI0025F0E5EC|nr:hypothetical protein [Treponema sp.]MCR5217426.1 hypothetical protein [Treponema sp.]
MDMYVVMKARNKEGTFLELWRLDEESLERVKGSSAGERIEYVSPDLFDEKIKAYDFKELVWDRVYNSYNYTYMKVKVPVSENFKEMESNAEKKAVEMLEKQDKYWGEVFAARKEKKERIYQEIIKPIVAKNRIIVAQKNKDYEGLTEEEAIKKWKDEENCMNPCATIISVLRKKSGLTWSKFKAYVMENY